MLDGNQLVQISRLVVPKLQPNTWVQEIHLGGFHSAQNLYIGKESAGNTGDLVSIFGSGRSPGDGNGNPLQYSFLENPMDRGAWCATVHGVMKSWT